MKNSRNRCFVKVWTMKPLSGCRRWKLVHSKRWQKSDGDRAAMDGVVLRDAYCSVTACLVMFIACCLLALHLLFTCGSSISPRILSYFLIKKRPFMIKWYSWSMERQTCGVDSSQRHTDRKAVSQKEREPVKQTQNSWVLGQFFMNMFHFPF